MVFKTCVSRALSKYIRPNDDLCARFLEQKKRLPIPPNTTKLGWPSLWLSRQEIRQYLLPLKNVNWMVTSTYETKPLIEKLSADNKITAIEPALLRMYLFRDMTTAIAFLNDLNELCDTEKHHPSCITLKPEGKYHSVAIEINTHSAKPGLEWVEPSQEPSSSNSVPNLTLRDVRFAILVEGLHIDEYLMQGKALERILPACEGDGISATPKEIEQTYRFAAALCEIGL